MADVISVQFVFEKLHHSVKPHDPTCSDGGGKILVLDEDTFIQSTRQDFVNDVRPHHRNCMLHEEEHQTERFEGLEHELQKAERDLEGKEGEEPDEEGKLSVLGEDAFMQFSCQDFVNNVRSNHRTCMLKEVENQKARCEELEHELRKAETDLVGKKCEEKEHNRREAEREQREAEIDLKIEILEKKRRELPKAKRDWGREKHEELEEKIREGEVEVREAEKDLSLRYDLKQREEFPELVSVITLHAALNKALAQLDRAQTELRDMPRYDPEKAVANIRCALARGSLTGKSCLCLITAPRSVFLSFRFVLHFRDRGETCSKTLV